MDFSSIAALSFAMSTDAFAAALGKGASLKTVRVKEALRTGAVFGAIEGTTPVVGWGIGRLAHASLATWSAWLAFGILLVLGVRMIAAGMKPHDHGRPQRQSHSLWVLIATGVATSIDAMAAGVGVAFLSADIVAVALAIGATTCAMATIGVLLGGRVGSVFGQRAEALGGAILIGVGVLILKEHLEKTGL